MQLGKWKNHSQSVDSTRCDLTNFLATDQGSASSNNQSVLCIYSRVSNIESDNSQNIVWKITTIFLMESFHILLPPL